MPRLLLLTRYDEAGSSSRVRAYQFFPHLRAAGWDLEAAPLLGAGYVRRLYAGGGRRKAEVAAAYVRRLARLLRPTKADVVWIEKELLPLLPGWAERLLLSGRPYVVDYDDATFHTYDLHPNPVVRRALGQKVDRVMAGAAVVVAGNEYLAARARQGGGRHVAVLPSVVNTDRYSAAAEAGLPAGPFTIGWIGSPASERALGAIRGVLAREAARPDTRVVLVGATERALPGVPHERRPWSAETEVAEMRRFTVGIMPLPDEPWERGKCGFKLVQCMAAGRPLVASPVGVNREVVTEGWNGFLADTPDAWHRAFDALRAHPGLAAQMGERGRERAVQAYSVQAVAPRLDALLRSARDGVRARDAGSGRIFATGSGSTP